MDHVTVNPQTRLARIVAVRGMSLKKLNGSFERANQPFRATVIREQDF